MAAGGACLHGACLLHAALSTAPPPSPLACHSRQQVGAHARSQHCAAAGQAGQAVHACIESATCACRGPWTAAPWPEAAAERTGGARKGFSACGTRSVVPPARPPLPVAPGGGDCSALHGRRGRGHGARGARGLASAWAGRAPPRSGSTLQDAGGRHAGGQRARAGGTSLPRGPAVPGSCCVF